MAVVLAVDQLVQVAQPQGKTLSLALQVGSTEQTKGADMLVS